MEVVLPEDKSLHFYGKFYKFLGVNSAIKTLKSGTLKFSNPTTFNDPLDCSKYLFDFKISNSVIFPKSGTTQEKLFSNSIMKEKIGLSTNEFISLIDPVINFNTYDGILTKSQWQEYSLRITQELFAQENLKKYRITCFSKKYNSKKSFLMWSHYAESHRGICLEFDNTKEFELNKLERFSPIIVQYQTDLPRIGTKTDFESNKWLWVKSNLFSYESEVRLIRKTDNAKNRSFFKFPINSLTKIIFGVNTSNETIREVKDALKSQYEIDNILFEKMRLDEKNWKLISKNYDIENLISYDKK